jgi:isoprenylcysteine carboxyl methyltransferase (ICMT) family protein YpbQ
MSHVALILCVIFVMRLATLFYSVANEKRIVKEGAVEYGKVNSLVMAALHTFFYAGCISYSIVKKTQFSSLTAAGLLVYLFSFAVLLTVMYSIRDVWTVKLYIAKNHTVNKSFIFKYFRHPNYFLNIIPELAAVAMISGAWPVFAVIFPPYLVTLYFRIIEEERVMKTEFAGF